MRLLKSTTVTSLRPGVPAWPVNWVNTLFLITTAVIALVATPLYFYHAGGIPWPLIAVFVFYLAATGLSITGGYHRLFAHRSYEANKTVKLFYLLFGAAACQNSALKWATDHRNHHRFVDKDGDPYNIRRGFFHAHVGWVFFKNPQKSAIDTEHDLMADSMVRWQHRFYLSLAILFGGGLPLLIGYFLGEALGCFLLAGVTRTVIVHHSTFLINSLCHFIGKQPYSLRDSSRDSAFVALLTCGEGFHNFHHRFQYDYRNGVRWYHFDPTKWLIKALETLGLARCLRRASHVHIFKARLDVQRDRAEQSLAGSPHQWRNAMEEKIRRGHAVLLSSYTAWNKHRAEYKSARGLFGATRNEQVVELERDLRSVRSSYRKARASWAALVGRGLQFPGANSVVS